MTIESARLVGALVGGLIGALASVGVLSVPYRLWRRTRAHAAWLSAATCCALFFALLQNDDLRVTQVFILYAAAGALWNIVFTRLDRRRRERAEAAARAAQGPPA